MKLSILLSIGFLAALVSCKFRGDFSKLSRTGKIKVSISTEVSVLLKNTKSTPKEASKALEIIFENNFYHAAELQSESGRILKKELAKTELFELVPMNDPEATHTLSFYPIQSDVIKNLSLRNLFDRSTYHCKLDLVARIAPLINGRASTITTNAISSTKLIFNSCLEQDGDRLVQSDYLDETELARILYGAVVELTKNAQKKGYRNRLFSATTSKDFTVEASSAVISTMEENSLFLSSLEAGFKNYFDLAFNLMHISKEDIFKKRALEKYRGLASTKSSLKTTDRLVVQKMYINTISASNCSGTIEAILEEPENKSLLKIPFNEKNCVKNSKGTMEDHFKLGPAPANIMIGFLD